MYDVAIVGAGPTGIVAANLCGQFGLKAVAFDRAPDVYDLPRAAGLHDDVQRILANAGLLDAVLPGTAAHVGAEFLDPEGNRLIGIEFPGLKTLNGFPPVLSIAQPLVEKALRSCLSRWEDVDLRASHDVTAVEQGNDHVAVEVRDLERGEDRLVKARWLLGADGAGSVIRKHCGIPWKSLGYDCEWLVVDVERGPDVELPRLTQQICDPSRPTTIVPMPEPLYRWEFQLRPGETRGEMEDRARVWELLEPWLRPDQGRILRAVVYRFHATIAERFRDGRIFLAGDAAHQTPPFMGQGMCTGLRDAENLVWKLAAVQCGDARPEILDSYSEERRPMAVAMVQHSTNTGKLIDAYAQMQVTGEPPSADLIEYGYGGSKQLPSLSTGLLGSGGNRWIGQLIPQCRVANGTTGLFDEIVGNQWAVLAKRDPREILRNDLVAAWESVGACFVRMEDRHADALFGADEVALVRPDRVIYSLGPDASLPPPYRPRHG